jgi:hypothetical protein
MVSRDLKPSCPKVDGGNWYLKNVGTYLVQYIHREQCKTYSTEVLHNALKFIVWKV